MFKGKDLVLAISWPPIGKCRENSQNPNSFKTQLAVKLPCIFLREIAARLFVSLTTKNILEALQSSEFLLKGTIQKLGLSTGSPKKSPRHEVLSLPTGQVLLSVFGIHVYCFWQEICMPVNDALHYWNSFNLCLGSSVSSLWLCEDPFAMSYLPHGSSSCWESKVCEG